MASFYQWSITTHDNTLYCGIHHTLIIHTRTNMAYKDGEDFTTYCDKPYDRHRYKLILKNGKSITYDDYEIMRYHWYQYRQSAERVEVVEGGGKGF